LSPTYGELGIGFKRYPPLRFFRKIKKEEGEQLPTFLLGDCISDRGSYPSTWSIATRVAAAREVTPNLLKIDVT